AFNPWRRASEPCESQSRSRSAVGLLKSTVAMLVLAARAAGTGLIAAHLGNRPDEGRGRGRARARLDFRDRAGGPRLPAAGRDRARLNGGQRLGVLRLQSPHQPLLALLLLALDLRLTANLHLRDRGHGVELDAIEHRGEELERLALV